jgi:O-antigen ligase
MEVARPTRAHLLPLGVVAMAVLIALAVSSSTKISFYLDNFERARLLYLLPFAAVAGLFLVIASPKLPIHLLAFLLPFNYVGGIWGDSVVVLLAKVLMNVLVVAALLPTLIAPTEQRAWLTRTAIGLATLAWLAAVIVGIVLGLLGGVNREFWIRESGWMLFSLAAVPVGTLLRDRADIDRLLRWTCAGVGVLQVYAFWTLMTGNRYTRSDISQSAAFFRAPYSCVSLFIMYLAAAALLFRASERTLSRRMELVLFLAVALLGGGLLASMVRSMWISGAVGMLVVAYFAPWDRRTLKAAGVVAVGAILAVVVVAAIDRLSPQSTGNWTSSAFVFLEDLGSKDSTSRVTREIEWAHALEVWERSPVVGVGFGYAYPQRGLEQIPEEIRPEAFYMHNSYLNIMAKTGLAGLTAFLAWIWSIGRGAHAALRRPDADTHDRVLATAVFAALVAVALLTTTMPVLTGGDSIGYLGVLAGLTVALQRSSSAAAG